MNITDVRHIARSLGIQPGNISKLNLIRLVQRTEGNFDCYGTAYDGVCDQGECLWRSDCLALAHAHHGHSSDPAEAA